MNDCLAQYYRCPDRYVRLELKGPLSENSGYFRLGEEAVCYGRYCGRRPSDFPNDLLQDGLPVTTMHDGTTYLPFDLQQVVDGLRVTLETARVAQLLSHHLWAVEPSRAPSAAPDAPTSNSGDRLLAAGQPVSIVTILCNPQ
jgi:hypothetical protein